MKHLNPAYCCSALHKEQHKINKIGISRLELVFLGFIISIAIDTTPFFNFHFGPLQISTPDLFLGFLIYVFVADMAVGKHKVPDFPLKISLLLFFAGVLSLVNLMYVSGRYIMFDVKISLKLFEHAALILVTGSAISNGASLRKCLQVLCIASIFLSILTILQSSGFLHLGAGFTRRTTLQMGPFLIGTLAASEGVMGVSLLILSAFPFMIARFVFSSLPLRSILISITILAAIITFSRSLWVSLVVEAALLLAFYTAQLKSVLLKYFMIVLLVVAAIIFLMNINTLFSLLVELRPSTVTGRAHGYLSALSLVTSNPLYLLFGAGKGQFLQMQLFAGAGTVAHNIFIDVLVSKGILVLAILVVLLLIIIVKMMRIKFYNYRMLNYIGVISIIGILSEGMFGPATNSIQFWTLIAIACSIISISNKSQKE